MGGQTERSSEKATVPTGDNKLSEREAWSYGGVGAARFSTLFGVGLVGVFYEGHPLSGGGLAFIGLCGLIAMATLLKGQRLTIIHSTIAALVATWAFLGYVLWSGPQTTVIHEPPTTEDIAKATAPIQSELDGAIRQRDTARQERDAARAIPQPHSPAPEKSKFYGLDDIKRWQFIKAWIDTAVDDRSSRLHCSTLMGIHNDPKALALYSEFYPLIYYSGWDATQGVPVEDNQPFGIVLSIGGKTRNPFLCASKLSRMLQNLSQAVPVTLRNDQITEPLIKCNYECVQIEIGGGTN